MFIHKIRHLSVGLTGRHSLLTPQYEFVRIEKVTSVLFNLPFQNDFLFNCVRNKVRKKNFRSSHSAILERPRVDIKQTDGNWNQL